MLKNQPNLEKQKKTKYKFEKALLELIKREQYLDITVKMLCDEADLSRSAFYTYYSSIDELLREMENDTLSGRVGITMPLETPAEFLQMDEKERFAQVCRYLDYITEKSDYLRAFFADGADPFYANKLKKHIKACLEKYILERDGKISIEMRYAISFCVGGCINNMIEWIKLPQEQKNAEFLETAEYMVKIARDQYEKILSS